MSRVASSEELVQRSLRWLVVTSICYRVGVTVPSVFVSRNSLGAGAVVVLPLILSVVLVDLLLLVITAARPTWLASKPVFFVCDMILLVGMTTLATLLLPDGLYLRPGPDVLTGFLWGTVGVWTAARGWRTGLAIVLATPPFIVAMAALNNAAWDADGLINAIFRFGYLTINYAATLAVVLLAERGARTTIQASARAGRIAEEAEIHRVVHDTALGALDGVALVARRHRIPAAERLALIREAVSEQLYRFAATPGAAPVAGLEERMVALADEFAQHDLTVKVVLVDGPLGAVDTAVQDAFLGAAGEALRNTAKYAGVTSADVLLAKDTDGSVRVTDGSVRVTVIDDGIGIAPGRGRGFGLRESVHARMATVGGTASVLSNPGLGTSVTLQAHRVARQSVDRIVDETLSWFPLVPLGARLLVLPFIDLKTAPLLAPGDVETLHLVVAALIAAHVVVLVAVARRGYAPWTAGGLAADTAVAAALYLGATSLLPVGVTAEVDGATPFAYVFLTVTLWFAVRRPRSGVVVLIGFTFLILVSLVINGVPLDGRLPVEIGPQVIQLFASSGYAALVVRMAVRSAREAATETDRAARAAARVTLLDQLRPHLITGLRSVAALADGDEAVGDDQLAIISSQAAIVAASVRAALPAN